jgi:hypothetical protein
VDPRLARAVPRDRVVVLVQRFFLLDTDRVACGQAVVVGRSVPSGVRGLDGIPRR